MSVSPYRITVRMYQVGFGDCFLLSFDYSAALPDGRRERHVLIDFGSTRWPKSYTPRYRDLASDIATRTRGKLDVLVVTHRHKDHLGGFARRHGGGHDRSAAALARAAPLDRGPGGGGERHRARAGRPALARLRRGARHGPGVRRRGRATLGGRQQGFRAELAAMAIEQLANQDAIRHLDELAARPGAKAGYLFAGTALRHRRADPRRHDEGARPADDRPVAGRRRAAERRPRVLAPPARAPREHAEDGRRSAGRDPGRGGDQHQRPPDDRPRPASLDRRANARSADPLAAADRQQPRGRSQQHEHHPPVPVRHAAAALSRRCPDRELVVRPHVDLADGQGPACRPRHDRPLQGRAPRQPQCQPAQPRDALAIRRPGRSSR